MDQNELLPLTPAVALHAEGPSSNSSKSSFAISSNSGHTGNHVYRKYKRSKSLSQMVGPEAYSTGEIRRIKERLLRTNSHLVASAIRSFTRNQKMTLASLALVDFMSFCSMSIMAPFFPKEASEKGLSETLSGFVFSFYALVMFISSPIFGKSLPRIGAKFLFLFGIFVAGSCNILFGMLEYIQDYTLFTIFCILIRGFEALGASAFSTASYVFVVNSFPQNIGSVIGILETFVGLGMSTGPVLGGILYSLGGFGLPFFVLGVSMIAIIPLNIWLLPMVEDYNLASKKTSMFKLIKVPAVLVTGAVVVTVSSTWAFLDPTLEPHLREFDISPGKVGLVFLLFSGLYGISSPAWGYLADKCNNHWSMMIVGLGMCTVGLLLLGPCPLIPYIGSSRYLWLDLVALSILGVSVALALMPTFQGVLTSAINGGCGDTISTYSVVAGVWSSCYSLGEVIGPALGGVLLQYYGFAISSSVMAVSTLILAIFATIFFGCKSSACKDTDSDSGISESWRSTSESTEGESSPLLTSAIGSSYRMYTEEKVQYYEHSRRQDHEFGDKDHNQLTDVRGTVTVTGKGSCEV